MTLYIIVMAPIPRANVSMATRLRPGSRRQERSANRRSLRNMPVLSVGRDWKLPEVPHGAFPCREAFSVQLTILHNATLSPNVRVTGIGGRFPKPDTRRRPET